MTREAPNENEIFLTLMKPLSFGIEEFLETCEPEVFFCDTADLLTQLIQAPSCLLFKRNNTRLCCEMTLKMQNDSRVK